MLTPLFYAQLAVHPDPVALLANVLAQPADAQTAHISPAQSVIESLEQSRNGFPHPDQVESTTHHLRWRLLGALCRRPGKRPLDGFVRATSTVTSSTDYIQAAVVLRLSDWLTGAVPEVLDAAAWLTRVALINLSTQAVIRTFRAWGSSHNTAADGAGLWSSLVSGMLHL